MRNNRNRKKYSKYRPIYILAAVALLLCIWSTVFSLTGTRDILRGATVSLCRPLTSLFDRMGGGIANAIEATTNDYTAWKSEKAALEAKIAEQEAALAELQNLRWKLPLPSSKPRLPSCSSCAIKTSSSRHIWA